MCCAKGVAISQSWAFKPMDIAQIIQTVTVYAIPVLFAITFHEAAHGYVARYFGDNTAHMLGRITANPIKHIDLFGTILMPLMLYFASSGAFLFGYAKPVPVRFEQLRNPKRDMIWVAFAGPAANFIQALFWGACLFSLKAAGVDEPFLIKMCIAGVTVNIGLFALNLLPLPPLDGGRILVGLLPQKLAHGVSRLEPWGFFIVIALVLAGWLNDFWMRPVMDASLALLGLLLLPFQFLLN